MSNNSLSTKEYGEPMKYDPMFKGPLQKRSCTDVICLLLFLGFLGGWGFVSWYAIKNGDMERLLLPTDSRGMKCGVDSNLVDRPYLMFFDLTQCAKPEVSITGCNTPQVCVKDCPKDSFLLDLECKANTPMVELRKKLICVDEINVNKIQSCAEAQELVKKDKCAQWYLKSEKFLKRCISALLPEECPRIAKNLNQIRKTRQIHNGTYINDFKGLQIENQWNKPATIPTNKYSDIDDECQVLHNDQVIYRTKLQRTDTLFSRFVGNIMAHFSNAKSAMQMGQMVVEDMIDSWLYILVGLIIAMFACLIFIAIMRFVAGPTIWFSIVAVIGLLGYAIYFCYTRYAHYKDVKNSSVTNEPGYNLNSYYKSLTSNANAWLYTMIGLSITLLIILLIVIFLRKRIVIAIALVKEGSKAVSSITSTVFFPLLPWILQLGVMGFAVVSGLYLASIGERTFEIVEMTNDNCVCSNEASAYKNGTMCDPSIFDKYCRIPSNPNEACVIAACHFKEIRHPKFVPYFQGYNVVGFIWGTFFISAFGQMVLASTFATWYWTFHKKDVPFFTLAVGSGRTLRYHLGTIAFGSLIITICRIIRIILSYIDSKLKQYNNQFTRALLCCLKCFFWCLENFLKFLNKNAYIMCAIHGKHFCGSAKDAFNLLMRNFLRVVALDKVTDFLFFISKLFIASGMGLLTYVFITSHLNHKTLHYDYVPVILVAIGTYLIATVFFNVYSMAVDTLFLCFLEDCERNDGSKEKPYFMSKSLMKVLGKRNDVSKKNYARH